MVVESAGRVWCEGAQSSRRQSSTTPETVHNVTPDPAVYLCVRSSVHGLPHSVASVVGVWRGPA